MANQDLVTVTPKKGHLFNGITGYDDESGKAIRKAFEPGEQFKVKRATYDTHKDQLELVDPAKSSAEATNGQVTKPPAKPGAPNANANANSGQKK